MCRLQPPPAAARTITGRKTVIWGGGGGEEQNADVLRCAMCSLLPSCDKVFSVNVELRRSLYTLHPEHILRDERGYGFEKTKRVVRDKRICFTTPRWSGERRQERDLNRASCRRTMKR